MTMTISYNLRRYLCLVGISLQEQNINTAMISSARKTLISATTNDPNTNKLSKVVSSSSTAHPLICWDNPKNSAECGTRDRLSVAKHKINQLKRS